MKKTILLPLVLLTLASAAFADNEQVTIATQLAGTTKEKPLSLPSAMAAANKTVSVESTKDFNFPTQYNPPKKFQQDDKTLVQPMTPSGFENARPGWKFTYTSFMDNGVVTIVGTASYTDAKIGKGVYGENSGPIYSDASKKVMLTNNTGNSASTLTSTTHFQVFAKPGQKYVVKLRKLDQWVDCTISCTVGVAQAKN